MGSKKCMEYQHKWTKLLKNAAFVALNAIKPLIGTPEGKKKHSRGAGGDSQAGKLVGEITAY